MEIIPQKSNAEDLLTIAQIRLLGDKSAFGILVAKYQSPLRRYLYNLTGGDASLSDDISQETFIKAYTGLKSFKQFGSFRSWLFRIAYHQFIDNQRTVRHHIDVSTLHNSAYISVHSKLDMLTQTLAPLSPIERHLIILHCIEECSHSEIATITSLPLGTVKTHIKRAKQKLKEHLASDETYF